MADDEILRSINAHIEQSRREFALSRREHALTRRSYDDMHEYMTKATEALGRLVDRIDAMRLENRTDHEDQLAESRAQRAALLRMLDEMERRRPGPEPA